MLKKIKYFIFGAIAVISINAGLSFADEGYFNLKRVDYPIYVNGIEVNLEAIILNFEGTTYIPLRKVANVTGSEVLWDNDKKSVFITNIPKEVIKEVPKEIIKEVPVERIVYITPTPCPTSPPINPITTINYSGSKYEGTVVNSKPNGFGKYTSADGSVFIGEFKNGLMDGKGTTFYPNGSIASSNFSNGILNGYGILVSTDGAIRGYWLDGQMTNEQVAKFSSTTSNNAIIDTSGQYQNTEMYLLLKDRLDKQLAADVKTEENICSFKVKSINEELNKRGILNGSMSAENEQIIIDDKNANIKRLNEQYQSDLAILKDLYGIQ